VIGKEHERLAAVGNEVEVVFLFVLSDMTDCKKEMSFETVLGGRPEEHYSLRFPLYLTWFFTLKVRTHFSYSFWEFPNC
jgi:hypothetical protein